MLLKACRRGALCCCVHFNSTVFVSWTVFPLKTKDRGNTVTQQAVKPLGKLCVVLAQRLKKQPVTSDNTFRPA